MPEDQNIYVTSHNQQGGITAYQVNLQPGDRVLNENDSRQLEQLLAGETFASISVTAVMGDQEALRFASQIKNFLTSKGRTVTGVDQALYTSPVQGQIVERAGDDGVLKIIICGR